jgi:hypothetical protein
LPSVGGKINAFENFEKRYGGNIILGMDFTREKLQVNP